MLHLAETKILSNGKIKIPEDFDFCLGMVNVVIRMNIQGSTTDTKKRCIYCGSSEYLSKTAQGYVCELCSNAILNDELDVYEDFISIAKVNNEHEVILSEDLLLNCGLKQEDTVLILYNDKERKLNIYQGFSDIEMNEYLYYISNKYYSFQYLSLLNEMNMAG